MGGGHVPTRWPLRYSTREQARKEAKRRTTGSEVTLYIYDDQAATPDRAWCLDTCPIPLDALKLKERWRNGRCGKRYG